MRELKLLSPEETLAEIRRLYFHASKRTIGDDLDRALDLLKSLTSEEQRERATVYMHGLAEMRKDWGKERQPKRSRQSSEKHQKKRGTGKAGTS
jgi:hypothetical protein